MAFFTYIIASCRNGTLYTGSTTDQVTPRCHRIPPMDLSSPGVTHTFHTARWKMALALLGSLGFVWLGVYLLNLSPEEIHRGSPERAKLAGVLSVAVFGFFGALSFARIMQPDRVILDPHGFRVEGLFPRSRIAWSDVDRFYPIKVRRSSFVAYELKPEVRARLPQAPTLKWGASDGALPGALRDPHDVVLRTMTEWRRKYG